MTTRGSSDTQVARRIVALFVACALVPVAATLLLAYDRVQNVLVEQRLELLTQGAAGYSTSLIDRLSLAELSAQAFRADAPSHSQPLFASAVLLGPHDVRILYGTPARIPEAREVQAASSRLARGGTAIVVTTPANGRAGVWLARPADQAPGRWMALELRPDYLWAGDETLGYLSEVCVFAQDVVPLHCPRPLPEAAREAMRARGFLPAKGRLDWVSEGERYFAGHREVFLRARFGAESWSVVVSQPEKHALSPVRAIWWVVLPVVALGLLIAALLGLRQVRRTLGPLQRLTEATRRIAARDFDVRVRPERDDEFGVLARALNAMTARLGTQFRALVAHAEIDNVILSNIDVPKVVAIVLRRMGELVAAERHFVLLAVDEADESYRVHARDPADPMDGESVALDAQAKQALADAANALRGPALTEGGLQPLGSLAGPCGAALPIIVDSRVAGALVAGCGHGEALDGEAIALLRDLAGRVAVAVGISRRDRELYRRAHYDALTQLPNRLLGTEEFEAAIAVAERQNRTLAALFVDLDGFSTVNDSLGHAAGDQLLVQAAARLRGCLRRSDIVARLGGDEFAIMLREVREAGDAAIVARHAIEALSAPFELAGRSVFVSASIGIAVYPQDGTAAETLLRHADLAMYRAKHGGRGQLAFFEASMNEAAQRRVALQRELRHALERAEFELHYQPQAQLQTGRVVGAEALIRWRHPERGLVPPLQFIGFAESSGLIEEIGRWALGAAAAQYAAWREAGLDIEHVSVNVSPRQLRKEGFPQAVAEVLERSRMPASALRLEITESAFMDEHAAVKANIARLHELGTPLELDDFGTGYSSLAYLQRLPIATVKLDRAFIHKIEKSAASQAIVRAAIEMAHALEKSVVAEGVEQAGERSLLAKMGCDLMQGYHLSPPLPATKFGDFLRGRASERHAASALR